MISRDQQSEHLQQSQLSPQYSDAEMVSKSSDLKGIKTINIIDQGMKYKWKGSWNSGDQQFNKYLENYHGIC